MPHMIVAFLVYTSAFFYLFQAYRNFVPRLLISVTNMYKCKCQGDYMSGKPGKVRELKMVRETEKVRDNIISFMQQLD